MILLPQVIVLIPKGSFQLTAQELSTIIRQDLDVTIFLIENDGYEIERWVHGFKAKYNDISKWRYSSLPEAFTPVTEAGQRRVKTYKVGTRRELEDLLGDMEFAEGKGLHVSIVVIVWFQGDC